MALRLAVLAALALGLGCGPDDPGPFRIDAQIVTADGADPFASGEYDHLRIEFVQAGADPVVYEADLDDPTFEVPFDLDLYIDDARVRVRLTGPSGTLHGAPPRFRLSDTDAKVRVVVGEPGTCAVVPDLEDEPPEPPEGEEPVTLARAQSGYIRWGGFQLQLGGVAAGGASPVVTYSDLFWAEAGQQPLSDLLAPAGRTKAAILGDDQILVVAEGGGPWQYALIAPNAESERSEALPLYAAAGADSAITRSTTGAVLVAGGGPAETPSDELALISASGRVDIGTLRGGRSGGTAVPSGDDVLVVGGVRGEGVPFAERVDLVTLTSTPIDDPAVEPARIEPLVLEGTGSTWVLGGTDGAGTPLSTSWVVAGCPGACTLTPGPEVTLGPAPRSEGLFLHDGRTVYRAVEEGGWHLEPVADLVHDRDFGGITAYESGMVYVHGGAGSSGPRKDAELCFPTELAPF